MTQHPGWSWSSWGCVQAFILTLTILILIPHPASAMDLNIDLLEALHLGKNISQYEGVTKIKSDTSPPSPDAFRLQTGDRKLIIPTSTYHKVTEAIRRTPEFTISAVLRQEEKNCGTIIAFSYGVTRYLELQSSARRNEIRFHFTYITPTNESVVHVEAFPYQLADNMWHKVSLSVSGSEIQLLIDCHPLYRRVTHFIPDRNFSASNIQLFVGQRNFSPHSMFKGEIQNVRIISGPFGYISQCPHLDTQCPTCGQFNFLQSTILELQHNLMLLTQRLVAAENRVSRLEECDCKKTCIINGTTKNEGDTWEIGCDICKCEHGIVTCGSRCAPTNCKFPVREEGECCERCLSKCFINRQEYEHNESQTLGCRNCLCIDGNMKCSMIKCPILTCPPEQQLSVTDECCKFCPGDDYCAKGHACHTNATCLNLNTKYTCTCHPGFQGDGFHCSDIDECAQQGGLTGNHCHLNTRCVNTSGSYICECLRGYRRLDKFNCVEIDECATGQHECNENAVCINTQGSYHCRCKDGYSGDGYDCKPVCNQTCLNGGQCLSPGVCTCRMGFIGESCEQDLDECLNDLHICKDTAVCINMPGWYYCKCKPGYETRESECIDIDECYHNTHSCHQSAKCVNTDGHFECQCPIDAEIHCRLSCMFEDSEIPDGGTVSPHNQPCKICKCNKGVITCEEPPCNCTTWQAGSGRDLCCPQCDPKESCQHQELKHVVFKSGEQWIYQCQTCECLYGEFDCWKLECPPLTCEKPLPLSSGDCCPRCADDPCHFPSNTTDMSGKPCFYKGHTYISGQSFSDTSSQCTTCACKDGRLCCSFDNNCADNELQKRNNFPSTGSTRINYYNNTSSETTTSTTTTSAKSTKTATATTKQQQQQKQYTRRYIGV